MKTLQKMNLENSKEILRTTYNCESCKDKGYLFNQYDEVYFCKCYESKREKERIEKSGIKDRLDNNRFDNYKADNEQRKIAKSICIKYIKEFEQNKGSKVLLLQGQVGSGKTHLAISTINYLLKKYGVRYMSYTKDISELKFNMTDQELYQKKISEYRNVSILYIDDLFKGFEKIQDYNKARAELRIMYDIINYRYDNKKAMIITSELNINQLLELDEALASRILEMAKGYRYEFKGRELNYRVFG
ncbi:MAG: ATP-binding protein [Peptostreptococcaceae bacterium]|nr:ATP-binding protein [Peptostreptococcaceae bacterium]